MNLKYTSITVKGVILDEQPDMTLDELCLACRVEQTAIVELVEEGIVEPRNRGRAPWNFSRTALPCLVKALRLQRDLELNPAGVAFALDLLEEIEGLRNRLNILESNELLHYD